MGENKYQRMLNKEEVPLLSDMEEYCGEARERFKELGLFIVSNLKAEREIRFPHGNKYGWSASYRKKKKLISAYYQMRIWKMQKYCFQVKLKR